MQYILLSLIQQCFHLIIYNFYNSYLASCPLRDKLTLSPLSPSAAINFPEKLRAIRILCKRNSVRHLIQQKEDLPTVVSSLAEGT